MEAVNQKNTQFPPEIQGGLSSGKGRGFEVNIATFLRKDTLIQLRYYAPPSIVWVYKANPNGSKGEFLRTEEPYEYNVKDRIVKWLESKS